ncbi:hypothetical protein EPI10_027342 [Gossypium australe]|uniref:Uncharacterized protein n=1 Tax=Gossypium australe TaxID=47621 RepID=A0A5B6UUR8_9ROSI|nr:hypothetical protein EPI10_027342 [Gossypium australe]
MVIISRPGRNEAGVQMAPRVIIQKPVAFPYKGSKKVPWNYDCNVTIPGEESPISALEEGQEVSFYTRSGRRYDSSNVGVEPVKGKTPMVAQKKEKMTHREALMKVLNKTYVANDISVNKLDRLVNNISANNFIFFNDDEILPGGMDLQRLCTSPPAAKGIHYQGLPVDSSHMKTYQNIVRAFSGTERKVMGRIEIPFLIDPNTYEVDFLVMDIKLSYNCLLERPWIHTAGAVPSSLHQKLKLVAEGRLLTINAE